MATARVAREFTGIIPQPDLPHNDFIKELNFTLWTLIVSSGGFLGLRIYCKLYRQRGLWWDDHVLISSYLVLLISGVFASVSTTFGFGKHIYDITSDDLPPLLLVLNLSGFFSILAAAWSKTSFAITLLRISEGRVRWFIWFSIVSINVMMGLAALFTWIQCTPVERTWNPFIDGTCWNSKIFVVFNSTAAAYSGLLDIVLATLPWRIIGRMTINKKERIGVLLAMSMGVFAGVTSIAKTITIPAFADTDLINTVPLIILGVAESAVTIMAASIPVLRALLKDVRRRSPDTVKMVKVPGLSINVSSSAGMPLRTPSSSTKLAASFDELDEFDADNRTPLPPRTPNSNFSRKLTMADSPSRSRPGPGSPSRQDYDGSGFDLSGRSLTNEAGNMV